MRRVEAADRHGLAIHRAVDDLVAVDGGGNGAAHLDVVKRRFGIVHRKDDFAFGVALVHAKTRIGLKLLQQLRRREAGKRIKLFGHHRRGGGRRVRDEAERHLVECDAVRITVIGVLDQRQTIPPCPAVKLERACADRCCFVGFGRFTCDDGAIALAPC